jgi:hypothetical protein
VSVLVGREVQTVLRLVIAPAAPGDSVIARMSDSTPTPKITRESALDKLRELRNLDAETGHMEADDVLLDLIGDDEIAKAFRSLPKWYA